MTINDKKTLYEFWRFKVKEIYIEELGVKRQYIEHPGAVSIIAINDEGRVLVQKHYRESVDKVLYELPAGLMEEDETPLETAKKELEEEEGYLADNWQELYTYYSSAGILAEKVVVFLATNLKKVNKKLEETEKLTILESAFYDEEGLQEIIESGAPIAPMVATVAFGLKRIKERK